MSRHPTHLAAWFQISIGVSIICWWSIAAATNGIVELEEGRIDILFHIVAELLMAALLIIAGVSLRRRGPTGSTTMVSGLALGTLLYSNINSPGYFAEQGAWWAVGMFAAIGAATVFVAMNLMKADQRPERARGETTAVATGVRSDTMTRRRDSVDLDRSAP